jgi:predicted enzyme related to lactoylglutathione lyase
MTTDATNTAAPQIVHFAIRVNDVDSSAKFYQSAFRMRELARLNVKNLTAVHMTDGHVYLSVVQYHSDETAESRVAGPAPCIHHFGMEVAEPAAFFASLQKQGCQLISPEGEVPIKFHTPDGIVAELCPPQYFRDRFEPGKKPAP